ncbi:lipolytic enzyme [Legionella birminghamensis]|uniref:Lipolytic enzyme n=1 Tax=Legionella birminghamensis TaxID=28083 RepID=A0A378ID06_9GAMM|nr:alpha/beta hydrolase [Legionella birminghamensis]KTC74503.1 lipolytic enzyme [Legionella birminghamensis]STX32632.1 lipolytic protein [Legionella birminghamensis]
MPVMQGNGIRTYYEIHGQGQPLVLIAGYTGDHNFWNLMLPQLAAQFQVVIFDNRGIGQTTDNGQPFTLETMAADVIALIEALGLLKPHILGQSMGAAIAQIVARHYLDSMGKLILLNAVSRFNPRTIKTLESLLRCRKEAVSFDLFVELAMPWFFSSAYLANEQNILAFKDVLRNIPNPQPIDDQQRQLRALSTFDSTSWLGELALPSLVIAAEEDIITLPEESETLAKTLPNAMLMRVLGGHSSPVEQAQTVNELILKFC